jgi:hypothetical protein
LELFHGMILLAFELLLRPVCLGNKVGILMELIVDVQHPVVLAGGGLGILSGLGNVSNIEMSGFNFLAAPGLGNGL